MSFIAAAIAIALKLWALMRPKVSADAVAAANAAQEATVARVDAVTAQAESRMAQAVVDAPQSQAQVVDALEKGTF